MTAAVPPAASRLLSACCRSGRYRWGSFAPDRKAQLDAEGDAARIRWWRERVDRTADGEATPTGPRAPHPRSRCSVSSRWAPAGSPLPDSARIAPRSSLSRAHASSLFEATSKVRRRSSPNRSFTSSRNDRIWDRGQLRPLPFHGASFPCDLVDALPRHGTRLGRALGALLLRRGSPGTTGTE
jgi:hypothetical protein